MVKNREFRVVVARKDRGHGTGEAKGDRVVRYNGEKAVVKF
jgi:hypothetical protein